MSSNHALPGMGRYIVTTKLPRDPAHDPRNKVTGQCAMSTECTDVTGQHHSFVIETDNLAEVLKGFEHVTRVERCNLVRYVSDDQTQVATHGLTGTELLLRSDLERVALDAYSVVFEPSRKEVRDHQKGVKAAVSAALLRLMQSSREADCECGSGMPEGTRCRSCMDGPDEVGQWLRTIALRLDPEIETRDID